MNSINRTNDEQLTIILDTFATGLLSAKIHKKQFLSAEKQRYTFAAFALHF